MRWRYLSMEVTFFCLCLIYLSVTSWTNRSIYILFIKCFLCHRIYASKWKWTILMIILITGSCSLAHKIAVMIRSCPCIVYYIYVSLWHTVWGGASSVHCRKTRCLLYDLYMLKFQANNSWASDCSDPSKNVLHLVSVFIIQPRLLHFSNKSAVNN